MSFGEDLEMPLPLDGIVTPHCIGLASYIAHRDASKGTLLGEDFPPSYEQSKHGALVFWLDPYVVSADGKLPKVMHESAQQEMASRVQTFTRALAKSVTPPHYVISSLFLSPHSLKNRSQNLRRSDSWRSTRGRPSTFSCHSRGNTQASVKVEAQYEQCRQSSHTL